jgi:hypothetical protein
MSDADPLTTLGFFPSTPWSAVSLAAHGEEPTGRRALGALLARYLPAMRTYLVVERRLDRHRADDLLQSFVAERVLEGNLLA